MKNTKVEKKFYNTREVAGFLGVSKEAVVLWLKSGKLKGIKIGDRWFIPKNVFDKLLLENEN